MLLSFCGAIALTFGCSLFAIFRGDGALRSGGVLLLAMNVFAPIAANVAHRLNIDQHSTNIFFDVVTTLVISFGFLFLGYRHGSIWLAPAMTLQGADLYIISQVLSGRDDETSLFIWDNVLTCCVAIALVAGTLAAARERKSPRVSPVFRSRTLTTAKANDAVLSEIKDAVFVFHLPQEDADRLMRLAAENRVLPSQYCRDLVSTFLEGDHYAKADKKAVSAAA